MADSTLPDPGFFEKHRDKIALAGPTECWLWTAGKGADGYGIVRVNGRSRGAHRESHEAENGAGSAAGFVVRHRCDTPACVNPAHLEIGTHADNIRDRNERGRQAKGSVNGAAKLTESDVRIIRAEYVAGSRSHGPSALGRRFGVHRTQIVRIFSRETWAHVSDH